MKKTKGMSAGILAKAHRRRDREPVEVRLSVRFRFGDGPGDTLSVMQDQRVPMVDSVLSNRDRILHAFTAMLVRASLAQPKIARELLPLLRSVGGAVRRRAKGGQS